MTTHEWTSKTPRFRNRTGERIEQGEFFEPTEHERRVFADRMESAEGLCLEVKNDGEVCGRDLPCQYHSN